jgi:hypothetical protein
MALDLRMSNGIVRAQQQYLRGEYRTNQNADNKMMVVLSVF